MICFVVTYSWYYIWSNEVLSKNEEEVAAKRSMKNLKKIHSHKANCKAKIMNVTSKRHFTITNNYKYNI